MGITNSFTLEASYGGSNMGKQNMSTLYCVYCVIELYFYLSIFLFFYLSIFLSFYLLTRFSCCMLYRHNATIGTDWNLVFWDNSLYKNWICHSNENYAKCINRAANSKLLYYSYRTVRMDIRPIFSFLHCCKLPSLKMETYIWKTHIKKT